MGIPLVALCTWFLSAPTPWCRSRKQGRCSCLESQHHDPSPPSLPLGLSPQLGAFFTTTSTTRTGEQLPRPEHCVPGEHTAALAVRGWLPCHRCIIHTRCLPSLALENAGISSRTSAPSRQERKRYAPPPPAQQEHPCCHLVSSGQRSLCTSDLLVLCRSLCTVGRAMERSARRSSTLSTGGSMSISRPSRCPNPPNDRTQCALPPFSLPKAKRSASFCSEGCQTPPMLLFCAAGRVPGFSVCRVHVSDSLLRQ